MAVPIKSLFTNNTVKTYYALDEAMVKAYREDRTDYAVSTARILLDNADLPLLLRTRACMIIACAIEPDFLDMAKEGVRVAELCLSRCTNPGEVENQLLADARQVLEETQETSKKMEEEKSSEDSGELVWEAGQELGDECNEGKAEEEVTKTEKQDLAEGAGAKEEGKKKGGKVPRLQTDPEKQTFVSSEPPALERTQTRYRDVDGDEGEPSGEKEEHGGEMDM